MLISVMDIIKMIEIGRVEINKVKIIKAASITHFNLLALTGRRRYNIHFALIRRTFILPISGVAELAFRNRSFLVIKRNNVNYKHCSSNRTSRFLKLLFDKGNIKISKLTKNTEIHTF